MKLVFIAIIFLTLHVNAANWKLDIEQNRLIYSNLEAVDIDHISVVREKDGNLSISVHPRGDWPFFVSYFTSNALDAMQQWITAYVREMPNLRVDIERYLLTQPAPTREPTPPGMQRIFDPSGAVYFTPTGK